MTTPTEDAEEWRSVVGYEGLYEVSDAGRVRSVPRMSRIGRPVRGTVLRMTPERSGHVHVSLADGSGASRTRQVHILVLEAFAGPRPEGYEACHNNSVPTDNRRQNLRWDTRSENQRDRVRHRTHPATIRTHCPRAHLLEEPNLVAGALKRGWRGCLACHRAHASKAGATQENADAYYARIMKEKSE